MTRRKGRARTARDLRRALVARDVKSTFRATVDGMRREYAREREEWHRRIYDQRSAIAELRATVEQQRELLSHPWRHLWRWLTNFHFTTPKKGEK